MRHPAFLPLLAASTGTALFSGLDAVMKGLVQPDALGAYRAMFWRILMGAALAGLVYFWRRPRWPTAAAWRLHFQRAVVAASMATFFFWGLARVPLAEAIALSFIAPLVTLYLAAVLLGEQIRRHAIFASLLGLTGVGVILNDRLGQSSYDDEAMRGVIAILISALLYAYNLILQRRQAQLATAVEVAFLQSANVALVLLCAAPLSWAVAGMTGWQGVELPALPPAQYLPALMLAALLGSISLGLLSWAYGRAEAQLLVTTEYTAFIWAAILGWVFYFEDVTMATLAGTILIVAGCLIASQGGKSLPEPITP